MEKEFYVYIMASSKNGTLYVGVTSDLIKRVWQHKNNQAKGFTQRHGIHSLVYFEQFSDAYCAITREKYLKRWNRSWKLGLIEKSNPFWKDLYEEIV